MAYVNVADWKPDQVTDWLKGLDSAISPYIQSFLNNHVTGQQLLSFRPDDLEHLGIFKIGHQEIVLEGVEHLRNIHYELDRENLQFLAMRLSCLTHSLHSELSHSHTDSQRLSTQILADIANIVTAVKPLIAWLDRPGFSGELEYTVARSEILSLALRMATCGQRDRFAETPVTDMKDASAKLAKLADSIIQEMTDPLILQPASLDLATIKKRSSDDLGFYIVPSFRGVHQISDLKLNSAAHQCGKIEPGDEIVQINYQTVVGWGVKHVMTLFAESPTEVYLTLKKRPRHTKVYGQIYVKPYRLPSKKRPTHAHPFTRRPEFHLPFRLSFQKVTVANTSKSGDNRRDSRGSTSSEEEEEVTTTIQHNLAVPAKPVHRRATITGASPLSKRPPLDIHELWHDLKLEKDSSAKQSTTSVVDFEERVSSVVVVTAPLPGSENVPKEQPVSEPVKTEMLSIKQRIELFSQGDKNERPKVPMRPHIKPQIRINSEPIFDENLIVDADKLVKKDISNIHQIGGSQPEKPKSVETEKNIKTVTILREDDNLKAVPEEKVNVSEDANLPAVSEEHGRVVETINRHLLLSYDDPTCDSESFRIGKMLESLSNSLPHSARFRKGIVIGETQSGLSTHSLPVRKGQNLNWDFDSSLSRTISRVYKEESLFKKEENPSIPVEAKASSSQNELPSVINISAEKSNLGDRKESCQIVMNETERISCLQDKPSKKSTDVLPTRSFSSCEQMQHQFEAPKPVGAVLERQTLPKAAPRFVPSGDHVRQISAVEITSALAGLPPSQMVTPPIPPPRPSISKPPGACYRAIMAARSIGRGSPKTQRKKNSILLKRRNIAVKDFGEIDCEGWLLQRSRRGSAMWKKRWCLVHSNTLYTYQNKQGTKAETLVHLPGFTVSPADEVKSRQFPFKVYHMGTTFYFAAETHFELCVWLDAITSATLAQNSHSEGIVFSESENEEPKEEVNLSSGKKIVPPPTPVPRPSVVPQQSQPPSDAPKKFGSLKKLGSRSTGNSSGNTAGVNTNSGGTSGSSLDRKYLRLLGTGPVPVPTAQYRSYRRVHNTANPPPPPPSTSQSTVAQSTNSAANNSSVMGQTSNDHQHQVLPPEMADYRLASLTAKTTPPVPRRRVVNGGGVGRVFGRPHISPPILNQNQISEDRNCDSRFRRQPLTSIQSSSTREYSRDGSAEMMWVGSLRRSDGNKKKNKATNTIPAHVPSTSLYGVGNIHSINPRTPVQSPPTYNQDTESNISSPDYPGLEYPPVFEPGTYTLDTTAVLPRLNRHRPS